MNLRHIIKQNCIYTLSSISWLLHSYGIIRLKTRISFHKNNNRDLIILANGPSLKNSLEDVSIIFNTNDVLVVNDFWKSPYFYKIKPCKYVLADPLYFIKEPFGNLEKISEALSLVNWHLKLYIPHNVFNKITPRISNSNVEIIPYNNSIYKGWPRIKHLLFKKGLSMPRTQNVLVPSMFIGINEGYKKIHLYGVDHSWTRQIRVNKLNQVCQQDNHFYDKNSPELKPCIKYDGNPYKMHEILRDYAHMFDSYHQLREYADKVGCTIINCTPESYIDAFERE